MDVLLIESHPGLGRQAAHELERAGHRVHRCTDAGERLGEPSTSGSPCQGLRDEGVCPLDVAELGAAVLVRLGSELRTGEHGAICAARNRIPMVVSGDPPGTPLPVADTVQLDDLPAAVERAAESGTSHASAVVRELLSLGVIGRDDIDDDDPAVVVQVERSARRLRLTIWLRDDDPRRAEITRAAGQALRAHDRGVAVIDVVVRDLPAG
jgi:hypothetical protein